MFGLCSPLTVPARATAKTTFSIVDTILSGNKNTNEILVFAVLKNRYDSFFASVASAKKFICIALLVQENNRFLKNNHLLFLHNLWRLLNVRVQQLLRRKPKTYKQSNESSRM
jgi:hypothetical protein